MAKAKDNMKISYSALEREKIAFDASPYDSLGYGKSGMKAIHDAALRQCGVYNMIGSLYDYHQFLGYGVLSGLAQNGIIRAGVVYFSDLLQIVKIKKQIFRPTYIYIK